MRCGRRLQRHRRQLQDRSGPAAPPPGGVEVYIEDNGHPENGQPVDANGTGSPQIAEPLFEATADVCSDPNIPGQPITRSTRATARFTTTPRPELTPLGSRRPGSAAAQGPCGILGGRCRRQTCSPFSTAFVQRLRRGTAKRVAMRLLAPNAEVVVVTSEHRAASRTRRGETLPRQLRARTDGVLVGVGTSQHSCGSVPWDGCSRRESKPRRAEPDR